MTLAALLDRSRTDKEDWKYTNLEALLAANAKRQMAPSPLQDLQDSETAQDHVRIVFVNGVAQKTALADIPSFSFSGDLQSGYRLSIGEQACLVALPLELIFISDAQAPQEIPVKMSISIGANASLTLLEKHLPSSGITILDCDINLGEHAKFLHGKIVQNGTHLATTNVHVDAGGYYNNFSLLRGGAPCRNEMTVSLDGEEAQATLNGVMLLRGNDHADTTTRIKHQAANCQSRQVYKTVLTDKAQGVFQGKICVAKDAQKSDGYQLSRALLLSDQAEMNAKPELEILADDVKCSHGSTIGDLDEDALFYLRARGLNETQARALLIDAFIDEMVDEIRVEEWKVIFRRVAEGWQA
jgi:Fe-S cluster assembly protein SufD